MLYSVQIIFLETVHTNATYVLTDLPNRLTYYNKLQNALLNFQHKHKSPQFTLFVEFHMISIKHSDEISHKNTPYRVTHRHDTIKVLKIAFPIYLISLCEKSSTTVIALQTILRTVIALLTRKHGRYK